MGPSIAPYYKAGGGGAAVTLDPANKGSAITLSGGNLTATNNAGTDASVKSTVSHASGKLYAEVTIVAEARGLMGAGNASATLTNFVGSDANGIGLFDDGTIFLNGGNVGFAHTFAAGDIVDVALDVGNNLIWFRPNGSGNTLWNNNAANNPATATGGASVSTITGPFFFMDSPCNVSTTHTVNFGATAYAHTPPAGFGNW